MRKTIFVLAMGKIEVLLIAVGVSMDAFGSMQCESFELSAEHCVMAE